MQTNLHGMSRLTQKVGANMVERGKGGKVITIGSMMSLLGLPYLSVYAISKGGLGQLTKVLAAEWGSYNIQVNCIAPGFIVTDLNRDMWKQERMVTWLRRKSSQSESGDAGRCGAARGFPREPRRRLHHRPGHCSRRRILHYFGLALRGLILPAGVAAFRRPRFRKRARPHRHSSVPWIPRCAAKGPGKCPRCGMTLVPGIPQPVEYPMEFKVEPRQIPAGREVTLDFRVPTRRNEPVTKFEIVHEKLFHLFMVSQDLEYFAHVHPEYRPGRLFRLKTKLPKPGTYKLLSGLRSRGRHAATGRRSILDRGLRRAAGKDHRASRGGFEAEARRELEVELTTDPPSRSPAKRRCSSSNSSRPTDWSIISAHGAHAGGEQRSDRHYPQPSVHCRWRSEFAVQYLLSARSDVQDLGAVPAEGRGEYGAFTLPVEQLK